MAYMHAFENSVEASSLYTNWLGPAGGTEKIKMYQDSLGIASQPDSEISRTGPRSSA